MYICMYVLMCVFICVSIYIYIYIYIYMYVRCSGKILEGWAVEALYKDIFRAAELV